MQKHRENIRKYKVWGGAMFVLVVAWLLYLLAALVQPASAQGVVTPTPTPRAYVTPTPLPDPQATAQAAQQRADDARANIQQAAELEARAAEIRRNADVQAQQASQAWSDARAAVAAQNAAAAGEAIGRGESALDQLRASVNGQAVIIATLQAGNDRQASIIISMTNELNLARQEKQTAITAYTTAQTKIAENDRTDLLGNIITMFVFIVVVVLFIALAWYVIRNRNGARVIDSESTVIEPEEEEEEEPIDSEVMP